MRCHVPPDWIDRPTFPDRPNPHPHEGVTIEYVPEFIESHPWFNEVMGGDAIGMTRCNAIFSCTCSGTPFLYATCDLGIAWRWEYSAEFEVTVLTRITIDVEKIRRRGGSLTGTYGHEQRHVFNCREKAEQIANNLSAGGFDDLADCEAQCQDKVKRAREEFDEWFRVETQHGHGTPLPRKDYPPKGTMPDCSGDYW